MLTCAEMIAAVSTLFTVRQYSMVAHEIVDCIPGSKLVESDRMNRWARISFPDGSTAVVNDDEVLAD